MATRVIQREPLVVNTVVPQPLHPEAIRTTRTVRTGDGTRRINYHTDTLWHQPPPVVRQQVVPQPPIVVRQPITERVHVKVPVEYQEEETVLVPHTVVEHVVREEPVTTLEEQRRDVEEVIQVPQTEMVEHREVVVTQVPVTKMVPQTITRHVVDKVPTTSIHHHHEDVQRTVLRPETRVRTRVGQKDQLAEVTRY